MMGKKWGAPISRAMIIEIAFTAEQIPNAFRQIVVFPRNGTFPRFFRFPIHVLKISHIRRPILHN